MAPISWTSKWRMPERSASDLAGRREDLGQDLVEGILHALGIGLLALTAEVRTALAVGGVQLLLGGLGRGCSLAHLVPHLCHLGEDLLVGQVGVVRFEAVDALDRGEQVLDVGFVAAAHEAGEDLRIGVRSIGRQAALPRGWHPATRSAGGRSKPRMWPQRSPGGSRTTRVHGIFAYPLCQSGRCSYTSSKRRRPPSGVVYMRP